MSKKPISACPVCSKSFNDSTRLPLSTPCQHTHCLVCLRESTLALHPGTEASREGQLPSGKEIECLTCQKQVNTDNFVIDRAALATVPLSLDDLIITSYFPPEPQPSKSDTSRGKTQKPAREGNTHTDPVPQDPEYGLAGNVGTNSDTTTRGEYPQEPARDLADGGKGEDSQGEAESDEDTSVFRQAPLGWNLPPRHPAAEALNMDPHHPHQQEQPHHQEQHHHQQQHHPQQHYPQQHHPHGPGAGWAVSPGYVPPPTGPYTHMPQPHGHHPHPHHQPHPHHHHGHAVAAGAAGVGVGVAAGVGAAALVSHKKKGKKEKKKKHHKEGKKHKEGRHRSSSSSSSGSSSSSSSRSSKSSHSS